MVIEFEPLIRYLIQIVGVLISSPPKYTRKTNIVHPS